MNEGDGGVIIATSSSGALVPAPNTIPYGGAKAALNAMTVSLAHGYGPKVRVNAISAGPFLTDISKAWPEEMRETSDNALKRPGRPEEIVGTALWLASEASSREYGLGEAAHPDASGRGYASQSSKDECTRQGCECPNRRSACR